MVHRYYSEMYLSEGIKTNWKLEYMGAVIPGLTKGATFTVTMAFALIVLITPTLMHSLT